MAKPIATSSWSDWWLGSEPSCDDQIKSFEFARAQASLRPRAESSIAIAESAYSLAERLHAVGDDRAVDYWARAIAWTGDAIQGRADCRCRPKHALQCKGSDQGICRVVRVRQSAIIRTITCAPRYGRLDPTSHLMINGATQTHFIPIAHQGFAWNPNDFGQLLVFEPPDDAPGNVCGQGVPIVVLRSARCGAQCDGFLLPNAPFAATAIINLPTFLFDDSQDPRLSEVERTSAASENARINRFVVENASFLQ